MPTCNTRCAAGREQLIFGDQCLRDHADGVVDLRWNLLSRIARARPASVPTAGHATFFGGFHRGLLGQGDRIVGILLDKPRPACRRPLSPAPTGLRSIALIDSRQARSGYFPSMLSMWSRQAAR